MTKKKKVVVTTSKSESLKPTASRITKSNQTGKSGAEFEQMVFGRKNFMWMLAGVGLIALGTFLMSGGHMPDENTWDPDLIYSFRRITLAPVIILAGLVFQIIAIFKR